MELTDYARILRKRWWIIAVAVALTAGSAYAFSELQPREYTSTAEVIIEPARPDWGLAQAAKMVLRTYMTVIDSDKTAQKVIDKLQLSMLPEQLRSKAHFAAEDDRMVIKIEIEDNDGEQANRIAAEWAQQLIDWRDQKNTLQRKEDRVYAELRDYPSYTQSWPPGTKVMLAAGAIFGLAIAGVIIFFLEWLETGVVRTPQDLERQLNLTVVGAIPSSE
jgi:capsular polysaccharide biosynthesis protein